MKRLLLIFSLLTIAFEVVAQSSKNTLEIDPASFRPVQTDALSGVAIDPIGLDRSKRPCARVKMHVNRMTRDEIANLEIRLPGGNVVLMKKTVAVEGNGLIFELTAKEQTRFYLHHEKYGDSNEVTVNLEPNKEYRIEAQLNLLFSITVASNTNDAEVYVDDVFKGRTANGQVLTIEEVLPGEHTLKLQYGSSVKEQCINVNSGSIYFRQDVDVAGMQPQFVIFAVQPVTAVVVLDGEILPLDEGGATFKSLKQGTYNYRVDAKDYHTESGTIVVGGSEVRKIINLKPAFGYLRVLGESAAGASVYVDNKLIGTAPIQDFRLPSGNHNVQIVKAKYKTYSAEVIISDSQTKNITPSLEANFAQVSLTVADGAEIWINNKNMGAGSWSGELGLGNYRVECRKEGYRTSVQSVDVTTSVPMIKTLIPPTPIYGNISIISNPLMATIKVDGKTVGETPKNLSNILIGKHTIEISKSGYESWHKEVSVAEGQTASVSATLSKVATVNSAVSTAKTYKVGDYYNDGKKEGVVFWVDETGQHGKIVSLTESSRLPWSSDTAEQKRLIGADSKSDGAKNMDVVKQIPGWQSKYPAFKWCADLGEGWYLPAIEELKIFALNNTVHDAVNRTLETKGKKLANKGDSRWYWSSTESNDRYIGADEFCAWGVGMFGGSTGNYNKSGSGYVRAIAAVTFGESESKTASPASATPATQVASSKTYKVGDYYNDGRKVGVVFWVDESGKHGKIVSLSESSNDLQWSSGTNEQKRLIGADDENNGANNMAKVKQISGWETKYPAFKWCADLGDGWYLPAIEELKIFILNNTVRNAVNRTLKTKGKKLANKGDHCWYWSSTEHNYQHSSGEFCAWYVGMNVGGTGNYGKCDYYYVRAVSAF